MLLDTLYRRSGFWSLFKLDAAFISLWIVCNIALLFLGLISENVSGFRTNAARCCRLRLRFRLRYTKDTTRNLITMSGINKCMQDDIVDTCNMENEDLRR